MKKIKSVLLLIAVFLVPIVVVLGASMGSVSHPAHGQIIDTELFQIDQGGDTVIMFFGYVGCSYICPASLYKIDDLLDEKKNNPEFSDLTILFADIASRPGVVTANNYAKKISSRMHGINLSKEQLKYAVDTFNLRIRDTKRADREIYHTDHFFVLKRDGKNYVVTAVLPNQVSSEVLADTIEQQKI